MGGWLLRRLAQTATGIWLLASAVFLLSHLGPGTEQQVLPEATDLSASHGTAGSAGRAATRAAIRRRLGLDQPVFYFSRAASVPPRWQWHGTHNQYHAWLLRLLQGDLGASLRTGQPVFARLRQALAFTLPITGVAALLTLAGALLLAQRVALGGWQATVLRSLLTSLQALPLFVLALALLLLLANPAVLNWFPAYGTGSASETAPGSWAEWLSWAAHAVLPVSSLALAALPALTLQLAASLRHEQGSHYATAARARGLAEAQVIRRHALRNALLPLLTQFTGLLPALAAGAVVVEVVFAVPGMGRLLADAATTRDYPLLVGGVVFTGAARLLGLLLADVLYFRADPRIR